MPDNRMSLMGVGGKIGLILIVYLAIAEAVTLATAPLFRITEKSNETLMIVGIIAAIVGFALNLVAAFSMMGAYKGGKLATKGLYSVFINPMYTLQLLITLPGLLLLLNSWLALTTVPVAFIAFKIFIKEEERYLEDKFGDEYRAYRKSVLIKL